jgi:hypothetical protein
MLHVKSVRITPPIRRGFIACAEIELLDTDGNGLTVAGCPIGRNSAGKVFVRTPEVTFKQPWGWTAITVVQFTPVIWAEIQRAVWKAYDAYEQLQEKRKGPHPWAVRAGPEDAAAQLRRRRILRGSARSQ